MTLTVSRIEQIAQGVKVFELRDTAGGTLPACDSGAHIELRLPRPGTSLFAQTSQ
jgi:ferredoxin-NADP reductase